MEKEHGKILLQSELDDIATACLPFYRPKIAAIEAENARLRNIIARILQCNKEAASGSLFDCVDNDGDHYQSALLAGALSSAEIAIERADK